MGVLEGCDRFLKYLFFFFTFVFFLVGLSSIAIGIWALVDKSFGEVIDNLNIPDLDSHALQAAAVILIVVGVLVMLIGALGCLGAARENQCFLTVFAICLFLIFALMVAGAVMAYGYKDELKSLINKGLGVLKDDYAGNNKKNLDKIQKDVKCCMFENGMNNGTKVDSCFPSSSSNSTASPQPYEDDCGTAIMAKLSALLDKYKVRIAGIGVAACIIVLIGIIISMALCCKIRRGYQNV